MILFRPDSDKAAVPAGAKNLVVDNVMSTITAPRLWLETRYPEDHNAEETFISAMSNRTAAGSYINNIAGRQALEKCGHLLAVAEARTDLAEQSLGIIAVTSSAGGVLSLGADLKGIARLRALVFDAGELAKAVGTAETSATIIQAAATLVLAAHNVSVPAIWHGGINDDRKFADTARFARELGFAGVVTTTPQEFSDARAVFG